MGIVIKSGILQTLKFHLYILSCHFWLNLWCIGDVIIKIGWNRNWYDRKCKKICFNLIWNLIKGSLLGWVPCLEGSHWIMPFKCQHDHTTNTIDSLWLSDAIFFYAIWRHRSGSTLAQVMACCLMASSHYLNQCWLIISKVLWYSSSEGNFIRDTSATIH